MENLIYKNETYSLVGICMEVHNELGPGLLEIIYKEAIQWEFENNAIPYEREKEYPVFYKNIRLKKYFFADFVVFNKIILEIKATKGISDEDLAQIINYLKISNCRLGLIVNFGRSKLEFKRLVN